MIKNKSIETSKIDECEKICKFYQKFIDSVSNVSPKIIEEQLKWQELWLDEAKRIYTLLDS